MLLKGALAFSVPRFWLLFISVLSFFGFWCSLWFVDFQSFSMWFSIFVKNTNRFSNLVSDVGFDFFLLSLRIGSSVQTKEEPSAHF